MIPILNKAILSIIVDIIQNGNWYKKTEETKASSVFLLLNN
jgi:hypothetical protein